MTAKTRKPYRTGQFSFSETEYQKVLDACSSVEDETLIRFTTATCMRREDVVAVEIRNIDLDKLKLLYREKKKGNRIREIHFGARLKQVILKYLKTLPKNQKLLFDFCGRTAYNKLQNLCAVAGVEPRPFHALRATGIKRCKAAGWSPEEVCELTGDTLRTIEQHYTTPSDDEMRRAAREKEIV